MWRDKEEKLSIHGMRLQIINLRCDVILHFGAGLFFSFSSTLQSSKIKCAVPGKILLGSVASIFCLAHLCLYVTGELTNSSNKTVVDNSGIAANIEINFNRSNSEVSMLYNDALCMLESLGCLSTVLNMRSAKNIWSVFYAFFFNNNLSWCCWIIKWICNLVPIHLSIWGVLGDKWDWLPVTVYLLNPEAIRC